MDSRQYTVSDAVRKIIAHCDETGDPPTPYLLRTVAGITEDDLRENSADERLLKEFRSNYWIKQAVDNPRLATFAQFMLRQPLNGGYADKTSSAGAGQPFDVVMKLDGVGEDAFD